MLDSIKYKSLLRKFMHFHIYECLHENSHCIPSGTRGKNKQLVKEFSPVIAKLSIYISKWRNIFFKVRYILLTLKPFIHHVGLLSFYFCNHWISPYLVLSALYVRDERKKTDWKRRTRKKLSWSADLLGVQFSFCHLKKKE